MGLPGTWLVLALWLGWWQAEGYALGDGYPITSAPLVRSFEFGAPTAFLAGHARVLSAFSAVIVFKSGTAGGLLLAAALAVWLLPLLAWASGQARPALPSSRLLVLVSAAGAGVCSAAAAAVTAYVYSWHTPIGQRPGAYYIIYLWWLLVAVVSGMVATAVGAAFACRRAPMTALLAAGLSSLGGLGGVFLIEATNGCVAPLTTFASSCGWRQYPAWIVISQLLPYVLGLGMFAVVAAALLAAAAAGTVRSLARALARRGVQAPTAPEPVASVPAATGPRALRRTCAMIVCAAAVVLAGPARILGHPPQAAAATDQDISPWSTGISPPSASVRRLQVAAWLDYGGTALITRTGSSDRLGADVARLGSALEADPTLPTFRQAAAPIAKACADIGRGVRSARAYFPVPGSQQERLWVRAVALAQQGSAGCVQAVAQANTTRLVTAVKELTSVSAIELVLVRELSAEMGES